MTLYATFLVSLAIAGSGAAAQAKVFPHAFDPTVPRATDFQVSVDGHAVDVCDANPDGTFQDQPPKLPFVTDPGAFAGFDFLGTVTVTVTVPGAISSIEVRPKRLGIVPQVEGNRATFRLHEPAMFGVEINRRPGRPLMIFAHAPDPQAPRAGAAGVAVYRGGPLPAPETFSTLLFPAGLHWLGPQVIEGWKGKTVYLAAGAWVQGAIIFRECENVTIRGRGVLVRSDQSNPERSANCLWFAACRNCTAEDLTIINRFRGWSVMPFNSQGITVRGLKVFSYRGASDGIDVSGSENVTIDGCFVCTQDDGISLKSGQRLSGGRPLRNITVQNSAIWFSGIDVGFEMATDTVENITVRNMDFIRTNPNNDAGENQNIWRGVLKVNNCDHALVKNVRFENIRVEAPQSNYLLSARVFKSYASRQPYRPGQIDGVTFRNIAVSGTERLPPSLFGGFGPENLVRNVVVENLTLGGRPVTTPETFQVNQFTERIVLKTEGAEPLTITPQTRQARRQPSAVEKGDKVKSAAAAPVPGGIVP